MPIFQSFNNSNRITRTSLTNGSDLSNALLQGFFGRLVKISGSINSISDISIIVNRISPISSTVSAISIVVGDVIINPSSGKIDLSGSIYCLSYVDGTMVYANTNDMKDVFVKIKGLDVDCILDTLKQDCLVKNNKIDCLANDIDINIIVNDNKLIAEIIK